MGRFRACFLDYGNTVVAFDQREIDFVLQRLGVVWAGLIGPIELDELRVHMRRVAALPHRGDPPSYREHEPIEQMELLVRSVLGAGVEPDPEVVRELNELLQTSFLDSLRIEEGAVAVLERLASRLRLGIVSNYPCGPTIRESLRRLELERFFDPVVVSGEVGWVKPHAAPFEEALRAAELRPEDVLFVGDRWDADMVGAHRLGMATCHILGHTSDRDLGDRYQRYLPDHRIAHLDELEELL